MTQQESEDSPYKELKKEKVFRAKELKESQIITETHDLKYYRIRNND